MAASPEQLDLLIGATIRFVEVRSDECVVVAFSHDPDEPLGHLIVEPHEVHFYPEAGDPDGR